MLYSSCVRDHMLPAPYTLELGVTLAHAASCLRAWGVDSVPVVHDDALCGLVSAYDLTLAHDLGVSRHDLLLRDIPLRDVYLTNPLAPMAQVARAMARHQAHCAVVQDGTQLVGLIPWAVALSSLIEAAGLSATFKEDMAPSEVRSLILAEHANIRHLLGRVERAAKRVLSTSSPRFGDLTAAYEAGRTLCAVMAEHLELENHVLAPALEALDAWGTVRADRLRAEHAEQALLLRTYLHVLDQMVSAGHAGPALGAMLQELTDTLRKDMQIEEESLLRPDLLRDDPTAVVVEAG